MKKMMVLLLACGAFYGGFAQQKNDDKGNDYGELKGGFKQENIFVGGSISIGGGSGSFSMGANPQIGYTFAQWLDAGIALNLNYNSYRYTDYNPNSGYYFNIKDRLFSYGVGPFVRIFPINSIFVQGQFEYNWTKITEKQQNISVPAPSAKIKYTVGDPSFIAGIGYTERVVGQGGYFIMLGIDLLKRANSPYVGYDQYGQIYAQPILRTGINWYLKPSKAAARESHYQSARIL